MLARDIMTAPAITISPRATVRSAIGTMLGKRLSGLPVVDENGGLIGIISEGDLLRRSEIGTQKQRSKWMQFLLGPGREARDYVQAHARFVEEIMTPDPVAVDESATIEDVVELMESRNIKRVPVLSAGKVAGIVTRADLLRCIVAQQTAAATTAPVDDATIRATILADLNRQAWAVPDSIRIDVKDGRVAVSGTILDEREREAILVCAENAPGVVAVQDDIIFVDPSSGAWVGPPGASA